MAWWKLFWSPVEEVAPNVEEVFEQSAFENVISEPVRSIVKAITNDRKRFIIVLVKKPFNIGRKTRYEILDMDTGEEFNLSTEIDFDMYGCSTYFTGPSWASHDELKWAYETVSQHYLKLNARSKRIAAIRERNRLIEIYA